MKSKNYAITDMVMKEPYVVNEAILRKNGKDYIVYSGYTFEYTLNYEDYSDTISTNMANYLPKFYDENDYQIDYIKITIYLKDGTITNNLSTYVRNIERIKVHFRKETRRIKAPYRIVSLVRLTTTRLTSMRSMFGDCTELTSVNTTGWTTNKITDMSFMFDNCSALTSLDLSNLDISKVTNMQAMFYKCSSLSSLDLSNWNTRNVTNMGYMFFHANKLHDKSWGYDGTNYLNFTLTETATDYANIFPWNYYFVTYTIDKPDDTTIRLNDTYLTYLPETSHGQGTFYVTLDDGSVIVNNTDIEAYRVKKIRMQYHPDVYAVRFKGENSSEIKVLEYIGNKNLTDMSYMFYNCLRLTHINDMSLWNTENVTDMSHMLYNCSALKSLDLTNWNTENVSNMSNMFYNCSALKSLDLSDWDVSNVTDMSHMLYNCSALKSLDLINWNTENVSNMSNMFYNCSALTSLDLSNWNTSNVANMSYMFYNCSSLSSIQLGNWNTANVTNADKMLEGIPDLGIFGWGYNGINYNNWSLTEEDTGYEPYIFPWNMEFPIQYTISMPSEFFRKTIPVLYKTESEIEDKNVIYRITLKDGSLTNNTHTSEADIDAVEILYDVTTITRIEFKDIFGIEDVKYIHTEYITDMSYMFYNCVSIESINTTNWNTSKVTNMSNMFYHCKRLKSLDLSSWNTSKVTNMSNMFYHCEKLESLDLSNFNTSNVTDVGGMFNGCQSLTSLELSSFNTSNVTRMGYMFNGCQSLTSLDLSSFNTSKVTNMSKMFYGCQSLTSLDLFNFNTSKVTNMSNMFYGCQSLTSLDLSNFNTSNVTDVDLMFSHCSSLSLLNISNWDVRNVTELVEVFRYCSSLPSLDISNWDVSNITKMSSVFDNCSSLITIDLSKWDTSSVTSMYRLFYNCTSLNMLDLSNWDVSNVTDMERMFYNCSSLTYLNLSSWDTDNVEVSLNFMFGDMPILLSWGYDGNNYKKWTLSEFGTYYAGVFPWNVRRFNTISYTIASNTSNKPVKSHAINGLSCGEYSVRLYDNTYTKDFSTPIKDVLEIELMYNAEDVDFNFEDNEFMETVEGLVIDDEWTSLDSMFKGCKNLVSISGIDWDVRTITNMQYMFYECKSLTSLDLSEWLTDSVTTMAYMFYDCSALNSLKLYSLDSSRFRTINVTNMQHMFYGCSALTTLNLYNFSFAKVSAMDYMFGNCSKLQSVSFYVNQYGSVVHMHHMFYNCSSLTSFSCWINNTNISNTDYMFYGCKSIESIDLSDFNLGNTSNYSNMFTNVPSSASITRGTRWNSAMTETATGFSGSF